MPVDCVRVIRVIDPNLMNVFLSSGLGWDDNFDAFNFDSTRFGFFDPPETYELRSNGLLCSNIPCAGLKYVQDITDTAKFDDRFVEALSYRLAMDLVPCRSQAARRSRRRWRKCLRPRPRPRGWRTVRRAVSGCARASRSSRRGDEVRLIAILLLTGCGVYQPVKVSSFAPDNVSYTGAFDNRGGQYMNYIGATWNLPKK